MFNHLLQCTIANCLSRACQLCVTLQNTSPDTLSQFLGALQTAHSSRITTSRKEALPDSANLKCQPQRNQPAENTAQIHQSWSNNQIPLQTNRKRQWSKLQCKRGRKDLALDSQQFGGLKSEIEY